MRVLHLGADTPKPSPHQPKTLLNSRNAPTRTLGAPHTCDFTDPHRQVRHQIRSGSEEIELANLDGQVIGMNTAIATVGGSEAGNIGIGFAVPIDRAVEVAREIIRNG